LIDFVPFILVDVMSRKRTRTERGADYRVTDAADEDDGDWVVADPYEGWVIADPYEPDFEYAELMRHLDVLERNLIDALEEERRRQDWSWPELQPYVKAAEDARVSLAKWAAYIKDYHDYELDAKPYDLSLHKKLAKTRVIRVPEVLYRWLDPKLERARQPRVRQR